MAKKLGGGNKDLPYAGVLLQIQAEEKSRTESMFSPLPVREDFADNKSYNAAVREWHSHAKKVLALTPGSSRRKKSQ